MRFPRLVGLAATAFMMLVFVLGRMNDSAAVDEQAASKDAHEPVEFEARIREISPYAIRFHGSFVVPTADSTTYFRIVDDREVRIDREELDHLTEEVDEDPFKPLVFSGGDPVIKTPSFKLGARVRCEYVPGHAATKVVVQPLVDEQRRARPMIFSTTHELERPPEEQPQDGFHRRVSLNARAMPLKDAFNELARSAGLTLKLDVPAITRAQIDLNSPITAEVVNKPLNETLLQLFDWNSVQGVYSEFEGTIWFITTIEANAERIKSVSPEWLQAASQMLHPRFDADNQVVHLFAQVTSEEILEKLKNLPKLRELGIQVRKGMNPAAFAVLAELESVEKLTLRLDPACDPSDADVIAKHIGQMKSLRALQMSETGITHEGIRDLSKLPLTELDFYQEGHLTDQALAEIAKMKHLKSLRLTTYVSTPKLGWMRFTSKGLGQLCALKDLERLDLSGQPPPKRLAEFPKLTSLQVSGPLASDMGRIETLNDNAAADIAEGIGLKYLIVLRSQITSLGWQKIGTLPELRGICLPEDVNDSQIESLTANGLPKVTHVRLMVNSATDAGIEYLSKLKSLSRLDLSGRNLTLESLQQLKTFQALRSLHVSGLRATTGYLSLKQLTQLRELYLEGLPIKQSDYHKLEVALPSTRIYAGGQTRWLWSIRDQR